MNGIFLHYKLERSNDINLEFDGVLLADVSSAPPKAGWRGHQHRWTEYRIYKTRNDKYVVECVGRSTIKNEVDRSAVEVTDDPTQVSTLLRVGRPYLTHLAREALEMAHDNDPSIPLTDVV